MTRHELDNRILTHPGLTPTEKLVALTIATHADADGLAWPSTSRLVELTGIGRSTLFRVLAVLCEGDAERGVTPLLDRDQRSGKVTRYTVRTLDPIPQRDRSQSGTRPAEGPHPSQSGTPPVPQRDGTRPAAGPELFKNKPENFPRNKKRAACSRTTSRPPSRRALTDALVGLFHEAYGVKPTWSAKDFAALDRIALKHDPGEVLRRFALFLRETDRFYEGHRLAQFCGLFDRWIRKPSSLPTIPDDMGFPVARATRDGAFP